MKKAIRKILALTASLLVLFTANAGAMELTGAQEYVFIHDLVDFITENAKFPRPEAELLDEALKARLTAPEKGFNGMVEAVMDSLDEHSSYMTESTYNSFMEETVDGAFCGVGVTISITENAFVVMSTLPDSPAEKAGILSGDVLTHVNGENIEEEEFEAVRAKIRGPENTTVSITVMRGKEEKTFTLLRGMVKTETVEYEMMGEAGYLCLSSFSAKTGEEVDAALSFFEKAGVEDLILDLRNNPGGELQGALDVCRKFVPKGVIMRVEFADASQNTLYYNETDNKGRFNLVVLVNGGSASASELVAGAIQDTGSGHLIGTNTFGKGTVQTLLPIISGGAVRLTVAEYKTAGGRAIHHKGIVPDTEIENRKEPKDVSYMLPLAFETEWKEGDTADGVLAVEQRLAFWGYIEEADSRLDAESAAALRLFQAQNGLSVTGTADIYTQIRLDDADYSMPIEQDDQLAAALEYFNEKA